MKKKTKEFISLILVIVLIAGIAGIVTSQTKKTTVEVSSFSFKVGSIDANGEYTESKRSLYTPEMFECQGLEVVPDFEFKGMYEVFLYDIDKNFISASGEIKESYKLENVAAYFARIKITPEPPADAVDFKIQFYEVLTYASQLTITVDKEQSKLKYDFKEDLAEKAEFHEGYIWDCQAGEAVEAASGDKYSAYAKIDLQDVNEIVIISGTYDLSCEFMDGGFGVAGNGTERVSDCSLCDVVYINYVKGDTFKVWKTK